MQKLIGYKETKVKQIINELLERGIIERVSKGRATRYILSKRTSVDL